MLSISQCIEVGHALGHHRVCQQPASSLIGRSRSQLVSRPKAPRQPACSASCPWGKLLGMLLASVLPQQPHRALAAVWHLLRGGSCSGNSLRVAVHWQLERPAVAAAAFAYCSELAVAAAASICAHVVCSEQTACRARHCPKPCRHYVGS